MSDTALAQGDSIYTHAQMEELPTGSIICETGRDNGPTWEKRDDGLWHSTDGGGGRHSPSSFSMEGYNRVLSRPGVPPPPPPQETLLQYQFKFYENAVGGAVENGVSMDATLKGLRLMGLDPEMWTMGPGVKFKVGDERLGLPVGTIIANDSLNGRNPAHQNFSLFVKKDRNRWVTLLGRSGLGRDGIIMEHPTVAETPTWFTEQGDETSVAQILQFKARAWRVGQQIKNEQSWCGTYEHVIARVGVTSRSVREAQGGGFDIGASVSAREAARMPVGSLLYYRNTEYANHWAIYERTDESTNLARTKRIEGHRAENAPSLDNYASTMTVLSTPMEGIDRWTIDRVYIPTVLEILPPGTVFDYSLTQYIICRNHRCTSRREGQTGVPVTGPHPPSVFTGANIRIIRFEEWE
jgi:hypothetical protein